MKSRKTRRVFITGLGAICSLGERWEELWENLLAGRSGVSRITRLEGCAVDFGAEVSHFPRGEILGPKEDELDRTAKFAIAATQGALEDAGLLASPSGFSSEIAGNTTLESRGERSGIILGSSRGAAELLESFHRRFLEKGAKKIGARASPLTTAANLTGVVASHFGLRGPGFFVSAACSSASQAIGVAFDFVGSGRADVMVAGGSEACLTPFCMAMLAATGILSRRRDDPPRASRPFDRERDGCVIGEGAGIVVLEGEDHLRRRGGHAHCELLGYGSSCDAHSLTGVPENGEGLARAIRVALADAGIDAGAVSYVNAHGTSTPMGDRAETAALKAVLGDRARVVPVSSTKSMTGHLLGAAGGIEAVVTTLSVARGKIPPTINLDHPDPTCDLDYVPNRMREKDISAALSTSMGFGGKNACLVFSRI